MSFIPSVPPPIHRDGHAILLISILVGLFGLYFWAPLAFLGFAAAIVVFIAFRDPDRVTPQRSGLVISPADGYVLLVNEEIPPAELELGSLPLPHIAISVGVADVNINRVPVDGTILRTAHRPGLFLNPALDKASEFNERQTMRIATPAHGDVGVVQIAGILGRHIVASVKEGEQVVSGQRFGLIRFGSRVDVYLPQSASTLVQKGQRMLGGESVIADLESQEGRRTGAVR